MLRGEFLPLPLPLPGDFGSTNGGLLGRARTKNLAWLQNGHGAEVCGEDV